MTGPMIPAGNWPEGAVIHTWDSGGIGNWHKPLYGNWHLWESGIPMPPGHDWRVPVMRPAAMPAIDRDRLLAALERAAAAETELARLRDQQPAQAIDLEQFRRLAELGLTFGHGSSRRAEAERLLALIDRSKNSTLPHVDDINVVVSQPSNGEGE